MGRNGRKRSPLRKETEEGKDTRTDTEVIMETGQPTDQNRVVGIKPRQKTEDKYG